jgi:nitrilase
LLADQVVVVPSPATARLGDIALDAGVWLVVGVDERDGGTIYERPCTSPRTGRSPTPTRRLMPTGSERTVWGMGDGSTLPAITTPFGDLGGLICWENYMPLPRSPAPTRSTQPRTASATAAGPAFSGTGSYGWWQSVTPPIV